METETTWGIQEIAAWAGAISGAIGLGILAWMKVVSAWQAWRKARQDTAKGDVEVKAAETEAEHKRRYADATFNAQEAQRIIEYHKTYIADLIERHKAEMLEREERYHRDMASIATKLQALEIESVKRNNEHVKCQIENAKLKVELGHLIERVDALEGRQQ